MTEIYASRWLSPAEVLPPDVYGEFDDSGMSLMHSDILRAADLIREHFHQPIRVNNWIRGGSDKYRGYRGADCPVGAAGSQHKRGRALDITVTMVDAETARREILSHPEIFYPYITRLERDVSWLHIDCMYTDMGHIVTFAKA